MLQQRVSEIRTQIYLPRSWHQKIQRIAKRRDVSMATFIRNALKEKIVLTDERSEKEKEKAWKKFMKMAGFAKDKSGITDVSVRPGYYWAQAIEEKLKSRRL